MNVLAIETATSACALGVQCGERQEIRVLDRERRHTEVLAPGVEELLKEMGLGPRDLDRVVVDVGPGLFTGLRVGVATAIGLGEGLGCPLVAVTSLELLAHGASFARQNSTVVSVVDARRGEVFAQTFAVADEGVVALGSPEVTTARNVVIEWATNGAPVVFTGDGVERYLADFAAVPNGEVFHQPVPSVTAALTLGERRDPSQRVVPLYLREADAVANFSTRERRP
ncbi:MAG: tRNA (adenosine(37)-N6)-threonylcarbamoyltransferase complex dimerization subunit type 1 TsaB [Acidimicrobiales bacterium]